MRSLICTLTLLCAALALVAQVRIPGPGGSPAIAPGPTGTPWVTGQTMSTLRTDTADFGCIFAAGGSNITVTALGRWVFSGNSLTHTVGIYGIGGAGDLRGSVSIATSGATVGAYKYVALSTPVTLLAGASYYLISTEGTDTWSDGDMTATTTSVASITNSVYTLSRGGAFFAWNAGKTAVPVSFLY